MRNAHYKTRLKNSFIDYQFSVDLNSLIKSSITLREKMSQHSNKIILALFLSAAIFNTEVHAEESKDKVETNNCHCTNNGDYCESCSMRQDDILNAEDHP